MSEKHLIAVDLDGTLLKDNKTISTETKTTLYKLKEQGHKIMISTGRPYRSSKAYYDELKLDTPIVNFNGAFIHHPLDNLWGIFHSPLHLNIAKEIVDAVYSFSFLNIIAEVGDDVYIHYEDEKLLDIFSTGKPKISMGDLRTSLIESPTSMLIHADEQHVEKISSHLSQVHAEVIHHRNWSAPYNVVEIVRHGLSKAVGVKKVADFYGIPKSRIIAFGDEANDIEMIDYAGTGIAMANGIDEVKSVAKDITLSNEENGVSQYLQDYFNLK